MARKGLLASAVVVVWVAMTGIAHGDDVRRERSMRRPYIIEIGEPTAINTHTLQHEAARITQLKEYLDLYGYPEYAEIQEIAPEWPWDAYEVRLFYLRRNLETAFSHILLSDAAPTFGVLRFQDEITPEKRDQIETTVQPRIVQPRADVAAPASTHAADAPAVTHQTMPQPDNAVLIETASTTSMKAPTAASMEALVERIEAAADRASMAADQAARQSEAAVRSADRTTAMIESMERTDPPSTRRAR